MAERVVIIDNGLIIADGTAERLKNDLAGDHITVTTGTEREAAAAAGIGGGSAEGTTVRLRVAQAPAALPDYLRALDAAGIKVTTAETTRPTLDDVFLTLTGRSLEVDLLPLVNEGGFPRSPVRLPASQPVARPRKELSLRSYTSSTGVSPLRRPGGEDVSDRSSGGLVIATVEHTTEPCGAARRFDAGSPDGEPAAPVLLRRGPIPLPPEGGSFLGGI
ncbi:hypothetical protein GCM10020001_053570 [Nonomuraea salmonea]